MTKFYDKIVDEHVLVETVNVDRSLFSSFFKFKWSTDLFLFMRICRMNGDEVLRL